MEKFKDFFKKPHNVVILVIMILYVIFGLRSVANASELVSDVPDWQVGVEQTVTLPSGREVVIYPNGAYSDCPYVAIIEEIDGWGEIYYSSSQFRRYSEYAIQSDSGIYVHRILDGNTIDTVIDTELTFEYEYYNGEYVCWSNFDILSEDGKEVFFQGASLLTTKGVANLTPKMIVQMTLKGIGGIMVVCLTLVIGFLAFRKGWQFLKTQLHQA